MTQMMDLAYHDAVRAARQHNIEVVEQSIPMLKAFILKYMDNVHVFAHLQSAVARDHCGHHDILDSVWKNSGLKDAFRGTEVSLRALVSKGPSIKFLVDYAEKASSQVIPIDVIPPPDVVNALLELFHVERFGALTDS